VTQRRIYFWENTQMWVDNVARVARQCAALQKSVGGVMDDWVALAKKGKTLVRNQAKGIAKQLEVYADDLK
jgi:hypothetical protein